MKNKFIIAGLSLALLSAVSCGKEKNITNEVSEVETTQDGTVYNVNTGESHIEWKGFKVFKSENTSHFGKIKFESGELTLKDGMLESGKFVADMNSLENEDLRDDAEQKAKLEGHLKSGDFFEVEKYPTATYEITKVTTGVSGDYNTMIDGNLTLKGVTKPVSFNANVTINEGIVTIATEPKDIMREDYGVKFQVPVQNGLIKNEVNVQIVIKATASQ